MKKILIFTYIAYFILVAMSCSKNVQPRDSIIETCFSDSSEYMFLKYYDDGNMAVRGFIINGKKNDTWTEWYADGEVRYNVEYRDGEIVRELKKIDGKFFRANQPEIQFSEEKLHIGVKSYIRVLGLYPDEKLKCSDNIECESLADNSEYDYEITPLGTGEASFSVLMGINLAPEEIGYPEIVKKLNITDEEAMKTPVPLILEITIGKGIVYE